MADNNLVNWMFKKETTKGTASITNTTTQANRFGVMESPPAWDGIGNQISIFSPYNSRSPTLSYGNRIFPQLIIPYCPTCPIGEWWFLGGSTAGSPNTLQKAAVGSGFNPAITIRCEEKGGDTEMLNQTVGNQCISYAERVSDSENGWFDIAECGFNYDSIEDNTGADSAYKTTQRDMCGADYQPIYIGSLDTRYTEPPLITYDYLGAGTTDVSACFNRVEWSCTRKNKAIQSSHVSQSQGHGGYSEVDLKLWGIMPNSVHLKNLVDKVVKDWSIKQTKASDTTKYKTTIFKNVHSGQAKRIWEKDSRYGFNLHFKAEYFNVAFTLEDAITFETYFQ